MDNVDYFKGLITMRKDHPAFRMESAQEIRDHITFMDLENDHLVGYTIDGEAVDDSWGEIMVLLNGSNDSANINVEAGTYQVMVNGENAGVDPIDRFEGDTLELPAKTLMVLTLAEETDIPGPTEDSVSDNYIAFVIVMVIGIGLLGYGFYLRKKKLSAY